MRSPSLAATAAVVTAALLSVTVCGAVAAAAMLGTEGCARPDVPAHVVHAAIPELPRMYRGIGGEVQVTVDLDASSRVRAVGVYRSTNRLLNATALRTARSTRFATVVAACRPRSGHFRYIVAFHSPAIPWTKAARQYSHHRRAQAAK